VGLFTRGENKKTKRERSYGILLDGSSLIAVSVEDGQAVDYESIQGSDGRNALETWLARVKPKERVTVAVVSAQEEFGEVEISSETPEAMLGVVIEERASRQFPRDRAPFAITSNIDFATSAPMRKARVFGVPEAEVEGLWTVGGDNVRFTLPGMAFTVDGVHVVFNASAIELLVVRAGVVVEAYVLNHQLPDPSAANAANVSEQIATEAHMVIADWARKQTIPPGLQQLYVTGQGAGQQGIQQAFANRGYHLQMDPISTLVDMRALSAQDSNRGVPVLIAGLAAAAAVAQLNDVGVLSRPGRAPISKKKKSKSGGLSSLSGKPASSGLKKAAVIVPILAIVALIAGAVVPRVLGSMTLSTATSNHATAQAQAATYQKEIATYNYVEGLTVSKATAANTVPWGTLLPALAATEPSGLQITNMIVTSAGSTITFNASVVATPASALPQWLATLEADHVQATTSGFSVDDNNKGTSTVTFSLPRSFHS